MNFFKKIIFIILGLLMIAAISITGCNRANLFIPEYTHLTPAPLIVTADQLYQDYVLDEKAAESKYEGKQIWIIEAKVETYIESENGNYLIINWFHKEIEDHEELIVEILDYAVGTLKLKPQDSKDFMNIGDGYLVEILGECQGISDGIITVRIDRVEKTGEAPVTLYIPEGREY